MNETPETETTDSDPLLPPKIVYALYAVGYIVGITTLAGVIYAYIARGKDEVADTHLTFQIRTFWISLGLAILGLVTMFIFIGILVFIFLLVWGLGRIISGFVLLNDKKPISGSKLLGIIAT